MIISSNILVTYTICFSKFNSVWYITVDNNIAKTSSGDTSNEEITLQVIARPKY